ncbi:hypothetical protein MKZ38_003944 [Zalerion maritima]|uniref:Uncharacterized protein n=1 Tax=Zalerion maritima TaxID=339359 RepID=A0AAD5RM62_9PEZI|nr:hypothetical protein MKZ38_003944 [Zalerion maritima]
MDPAFPLPESPPLPPRLSGPPFPTIRTSRESLSPIIRGIHVPRDRGHYRLFPLIDMDVSSSVVNEAVTPSGLSSPTLLSGWTRPAGVGDAAHWKAFQPGTEGQQTVSVAEYVLVATPMLLSADAR